VCGRGVRAATLAALARHTIRSAAVHLDDPAAILAHANEVLLRSQPMDRDEPEFCTAVVGVLTGEDGVFTLDLAVGGHPLPLLRRADTTVVPVGIPGQLLGVVGQATVATTRLRLGPGDTLVAVTDGVLECRHDGEQYGEERLAELLSGSAELGADATARTVEAAAIEFGSGAAADDIAVLAFRISPPR
ncbi:MAG: serine/threonine-protein phosphatase, partial [Actinobacteria bacterium]|nr:serine/threonine-protein phosphatase [Actinomycetota bacterium]